MGIKMDMEGRNNILMMRMLVLGQLVRQVSGVMIKDQRDGPHHLLLVIVGPLVIYQGIADQIPDRLGPVTVTLGTDQFVEAVEQTLINRDPEANCFTHALFSRYYHFNPNDLANCSA
jgi:hypothetical protein